jgi:long-subunit fatty acid transport protein
VARVDFGVIYKVNSRLTLQAGYAHLFPGPYLVQSAKDIPVSTPYIMWKYRI